MEAHLIELVYVYPKGVVPPGVERNQFPDDFDFAEAQFEECQWSWSSQAPQLRSTHQWKGLEWNITSVHSYESDRPSPQLHIAACSQDEKPPSRQEWGSRPPILYLPILVGGAIAHNPDGSPHQGICEMHQDIPKHDLFNNWQFLDWQKFYPTGVVKAGEFREIILCWCFAPEMMTA